MARSGCCAGSRGRAALELLPGEPGVQATLRVGAGTIRDAGRRRPQPDSSSVVTSRRSWVTEGHRPLRLAPSNPSDPPRPLRLAPSNPSKALRTALRSDRPSLRGSPRGARRAHSPLQGPAPRVLSSWTASPFPVYPSPMPRAFDPSALVALPRLDAHSAHTLAQSLEAATNESIRHYVGAVAGSIQRRKPATSHRT